MKKLGFTVLRLGFMWSGFNPAPNYYNETYVDIIRDIVRVQSGETLDSDCADQVMELCSLVTYSDNTMVSARGRLRTPRHARAARQAGSPQNPPRLLTATPHSQCAY